MLVLSSPAPAPLIQSRTPATIFRAGLFLQLIFSGNATQACSEVCLLGVSKLNHVDNEYYSSVVDLKPKHIMCMLICVCVVCVHVHIHVYMFVGMYM